MPLQVKKTIQDGHSTGDRIPQYLLKDKKKFFELVANESGIRDEEVAKRIYYGITNIIIKSLVKNGRIVLPDFGEYKINFSLHLGNKYGRNYLLNQDGVKFFSRPYVLKFRMYPRLKKLLNSFRHRKIGVFKEVEDLAIVENGFLVRERWNGAVPILEKNATGMEILSEEEKNELIKSACVYKQKI